MEARMRATRTVSKAYEESIRAFKVVNSEKKRSSWNNRRAMEKLKAYKRTRDPCIRNQIFEEYLDLASIYAWKYSGRGVDYEDLRQEGCVGLLRAIEGFDPCRGVQFHTYATYFVEGYIRQYFRDKAWIFYVPRNVKVMALRIKELSNELGRTPTKQEIVSLCDVPANRVDDALSAFLTWNLVSLYHGESGASFNTVFMDETFYIDEDLERVPLRIDMKNASDKMLDNTEASIVKMYYEDELSQREIACKLGTYQMMVSRLLKRSTEKLGMALLEEEKIA